MENYPCYMERLIRDCCQHHIACSGLNVWYMYIAGRGGGPSIRDGPDAIARLIDRTRHTDKDNYPGKV